MGQKEVKESKTITTLWVFNIGTAVTEDLRTQWNPFFEISWLVNWIRDDLEGVALLLEPLDALGKGSAQLVDGLERVVESDDGAIAGVAPRSVGFAIRPH